MRNSSKRLSAAGFSAALVLFAALSALYLFGGVSAETWDYNIPRRLNILASIAVVGTAVGLSAVVFQTVTENYVLTPGIMGLDNLYIFIQTLIIYFLGSGEGGMMTSSAHFLLTLALCLVVLIVGVCTIML